jgi:hypothetical protein
VLGEAPGSAREREAVRGSAHGEQQWKKQRSAAWLTGGQEVGWHGRNEWAGSPFIAAHCVGAMRAYTKREGGDGSAWHRGATAMSAA